MRKVEKATLEEAAALIWRLPSEDFDKLRQIIDKELNNRRNEMEGKISPDRAMEVLKRFYDDFYEEYKEGFSQNELRNALRWVLASSGESKSE